MGAASMMSSILPLGEARWMSTRRTSVTPFSAMKKRGIRADVAAADDAHPGMPPPFCARTARASRSLCQCAPSLPAVKQVPFYQASWSW